MNWTSLLQKIRRRKIMMLVKRDFLPLISALCLWLLSLPCLAGNVAVTREEHLPDGSTVFTFSNGNSFILQPGQDPSVVSLQQQGGVVPPEAVEKWQKQMEYNTAHGIAPPASAEIRRSGPMGPAPRLPNGMLGWKSHGVYTWWGSVPDPVGWAVGVPIFPDGERVSPDSGPVLPPEKCTPRNETVAPAASDRKSGG